MACSLWAAGQRGVLQSVSRTCGVSISGAGVQGSAAGGVWGRGGGCQGAEASCAGVCGPGPPAHAPLCSLCPDLSSGLLRSCMLVPMHACCGHCPISYVQGPACGPAGACVLTKILLLRFLLAVPFAVRGHHI